MLLFVFIYFCLGSISLFKNFVKKAEDKELILIFGMFVVYYIIMIFLFNMHFYTICSN